MGTDKGGQGGSGTGLDGRQRDGLFRGVCSQVNHVAVRQLMSGVGRPISIPIKLCPYRIVISIIKHKRKKHKKDKHKEKKVCKESEGSWVENGWKKMSENRV